MKTFESLKDAREELNTGQPLQWQDAPIRKDGVNAHRPEAGNPVCSGNLDILPKIDREI